MEVIQRMMWSLNACILNEAWQQFCCGLKPLKDETKGRQRCHVTVAINIWIWLSTCHDMYLYIYWYVVDPHTYMICMTCCYYLYLSMLLWYYTFIFINICIWALFKSQQWYSMNLWLVSSTFSNSWVLSLFTRSKQNTKNKKRNVHGT